MNTKIATINDITIRPVNGSQVYTLDTNVGKYQFWDKKKDGSSTVAFQQYQKFNFRKGDTVEFAYMEKESDKVNEHTGKAYVNYTITKFNTDDENTPTIPTNTSNTNNHSESIGSNAQLNRIEEKLDSLLKFIQGDSNNDSEEIRIEDVPF